MSSKSKLESVNNTGFTVLYEPEPSVEPIADIVLIHGLKGHPRHTWTWDSRSNSPVNTAPIEGSPRRSPFSFFSQKRNKQSRSARTSKDTERQTLYWPYHLLHEDFPRARILTWGYNSVVSNFFHGSANKNHLFAHSRDFLLDLKGKRQACPCRPLIFMAHSLGGIIVKQMLLLSSDSNREPDQKVCESTKAIMFFGTPHRGSEFSDLGETMRRVASAVGFDTAKQNIRTLEIDGGVLEECHRRFQLLQSRRNIEIFTFHETHGVTGVSYLGLNHKVVPDVSAFYTGTETICSLDANHIDMCKFTSNQDIGYQRVAYALTSLFEDLSRTKKSVIGKQKIVEMEQPKSSIQDFQTCLDSLSFLEMDFRRQGIQKAHWNSCDWTFRHESYIKWVNGKRGLLWIKGKPGSGKSTLMKKILDSFDERKPKQQLRLYFFFHRRGNPLQYTQIGMFRTILHQLLSQVPIARSDFKSLWEKKARHGGGQTVEWSLEELRDVFSSSVLRAGEESSIRIFIDALDEAGEDHAQNLLSYVHELNNKIRVSEACISICFSCRKYPFFARNGGLEICVDDENHKDIEAYLSTELRRLLDQETTHQSVLEVLQADLAKKASGVFLWAYLMVPFVAKQYNDGEHLDSIRQRLNQVPSDLSHIYKHILTNVVDVEKRSRTLLLLQWIFLAQRPLTVTEFRHAVASDDASVRPAQYSIAESKGFIDNDEQMGKVIVSLSGGLAEVKKLKTVVNFKSASKMQVQFIHESVNDFLREDRFSCLGIPFRGDPTGQSHYRLCMSCLNYMKLEEMSTESFNFEKRFPLIKYVVINWRRHAEEAEFRGITLEGLLQRFEWPSQKLLQLWIDIFSILENGSYRGATLLHIAAGSNLLSAMRVLLNSKAEVDDRDDEGATPLHYATRFNNQNVSNEASVLLLLDAGADIDAHEPMFGTALSRAAKLENERMVRLLVEKGADVNAAGGFWGTALESAVQSSANNVATVRFLLENGADADGKNGKEFSALQRAVLHEKEAIVRLLVQGGANINGPAGPYGTVSEIAVKAKNKGIMRYLLEEGADVSAQRGDLEGTAF